MFTYTTTSDSLCMYAMHALNSMNN
jgi:hypothetical protein